LTLPAGILGGGIAALSAARILSELGHPVRIALSGTVQPRLVALNGAAQFLIERIWGGDLLHAAARHMLERRVLAWNGAEPLSLDDRAVVAEVSDLARRMREIAARSHLIEWHDDCPAPRISALPAGGRVLQGGRRTAVQARAILSPDADASALHIEATRSGWIALLPQGAGEATVMGVATDATLDALLEESRHLRRVVASLAPPSEPSPSAPRLLVALSGPSLAIGDAAMRFDPLSGDGIAGALRSAHLAALLVDRDASGQGPLHPFYGQRMARAMHAHLGALGRLYEAAPFAAAWSTEFRAMEEMDAAIARIWPAVAVSYAILESSIAALPGD
jgi:hypothetical protein